MIYGYKLKDPTARLKKNREKPLNPPDPTYSVIPSYEIPKVMTKI